MILVTGGAGYIGCHTVRFLLEKKHAVAVLDDLSTGHRRALPDVPFFKGNVGDERFLKKVFKAHRFEAVIHFAASCYVEESVLKPEKYFHNNVANTLSLLHAVLEEGVKHFVFSSTAATYGTPLETPIPEDHPQIPINPYGWGKLFIEKVLESYQRAYSLNYATLRYFNAAGAHPSGDLGEDHTPETHLIPLVLGKVLGKVKKLDVYGGDYDTPDGTCVRDYIHVNDLASAHFLALQYLQNGGESTCLNIGNGKGYTVLDVIRTAEKVTGRPIPFTMAPRRKGDPPSLVASSEKIERVLGWTPRFPDLRQIIETAWKWHAAHLQGYGKEGSIS